MGDYYAPCAQCGAPRCGERATYCPRCRRRRRAAWALRHYWARHTLPACIDCGAPATTRHALRCAACQVPHRRALAAARQRRLRARRATG